MSFASQLIHTCTIKRPTHAKTDQQKVMGETTIATGVRCRVETQGDTAQATLLGIGQLKVRRLFFQGDADVRRNDILVTSTGETMDVRGIDDRFARASAKHHAEVIAEVRDL